MATYGIRLLFRCKLCKSVENIENFSEHKKQAHLTEFQKIINTFVVFEEICIDGEVTTLSPGANNTLITTNVNSNQLTATVATPSLPSYQNVKLLHYENGEVLKIKEEPAELELNSEQTLMHCPGPDQPKPKTDDSIASCNFENFDVKNEQQDPHRPHVDTYDDEIMLNSPPMSVSSPFSVNQSYSVSSSTETDCETDTITEALLQYKCKLCSKLFTSEPHVKLHVGICQLYNQNPQNRSQNNRHEQNTRNDPVPINLNPKSRPCPDPYPDPEPFSVFDSNSYSNADPDLSNPMQIKNKNQYNLNSMISYSGNEYAKILKKQNQFIFHDLTPKAFKDKKSTPRKRRSPKPKLKPKHGETLEIPTEDKNVEPSQSPKPKPPISATLICGYCSQTFIRKCNLEQHLRTQHSNENNVVFKCQVCEFTSKYPLCIAQHMSAKHGSGSYYSIDSTPNPLPLIPH